MFTTFSIKLSIASRWEDSQERICSDIYARILVCDFDRPRFRNGPQWTQTPIIKAAMQITNHMAIGGITKRTRSPCGIWLLASTAINTQHRFSANAMKTSHLPYPEGA